MGPMLKQAYKLLTPLAYKLVQGLRWINLNKKVSRARIFQILLLGMFTLTEELVGYIQLHLGGYHYH